MFAQDSDFAKLVPNSYQDTLAYRLCTLTSGCGALYIIGLTYYVREHSSVHGIPAVFTPSRSSQGQWSAMKRGEVPPKGDNGPPSHYLP